jgi:hypothetical protein
MQLFRVRGLLHRLLDGDGHLRAHEAAGRALDAILRPGLEDRGIAFLVDIFGQFQDLFGAYINTQPATLASQGINVVLKCHEDLTPFCSFEHDAANDRSIFFIFPLSDLCKPI